MLIDQGQFKNDMDQTSIKPYETAKKMIYNFREKIQTMVYEEENIIKNLETVEKDYQSFFKLHGSNKDPKLRDYFSELRKLNSEKLVDSKMKLYTRTLIENSFCSDIQTLLDIYIDKFQNFRLKKIEYSYN